MPDEIRRIGRDQTPGERSVQLVRESPEHLNEAARNLFKHETDIYGQAGHDAWDALTDEEREDWKARTLARLGTWLADGCQHKPEDDPKYWSAPPTVGGNDG